MEISVKQNIGIDNLFQKLGELLIQKQDEISQDENYEHMESFYLENTSSLKLKKKNKKKCKC